MSYRSGITLKALAVQAPPWIYLKNGQGPTTVLSASGPMIKLLDIFTSVLNISFHISRPEDGRYGIKQLNGSYDGMTGILQRKEADIIVAPFAITHERNEILTFSVKFRTTYLNIITSKTVNKVTDISSMIRVFHWQVWLSITITMVVLIITSVISKRQTYLGKKTASLVTEIGNVTLDFCSMMLYEATPRDPKSGPGRILTGVWLLATLILMNGFCGHLRAMMVTQSEAGRTQNLQELALNRKLQPYLWKGTAYEDHFSTSPQEHYLAIYRRAKMVPIKEIYSIRTLESVIIGDSVIINEITTFKYAMAGICKDLSDARKIYLAPESIFPHHLAFAFRKDISQTTFNNINDVILRVLEADLVDSKWLEQEFNEWRRCTDEIGSALGAVEETPLTLEDLSGFFITWIMGLAIASVDFFCELWTTFILNCLTDYRTKIS